MTTAKTFHAAPTVLDEPLAFTIDGIRVSASARAAGEAPDPEAEGYWSENFETVRALPGAVLDVVAGSVSFDRNGNMAAINQAQAIPILRSCIHPEHLRRFEALLVDPDRVVDIATLWNVAMWVVKELTGRPTGGSGV